MIRQLVFLLLSSSFLFAQQSNCYEFPRDAVEGIRKDLAFLASDDLEGRLPGSEGDRLTQEFIVSKFQQFGLSPYFKLGYSQEFRFPISVNRPLDGNAFSYKDKPLTIDEDFYPLTYSSNGTVAGKTEFVGFGVESKSLGRDDINDEDLKGRIAVMEISSPDGIHPHSKFKDWHSLEKRIKLLRKKGAIAVILIHTKGNANSPASSFKSIQSSRLPVIFVRNAKIAKKLRRSREVRLSVSLTQIESYTSNIAGVVDNGANQTIVIGAHFDHLGFGGQGSRYVGEEDEVIHNGADDNASGTAGLLALAQFLNQTPDPEMRRFNYLLVAFSAEEMGLLGSKFFVEETRFRQETWLYMLNMDMIGRMENERLAVNGIGTSPLWRSIVEPIDCGLSLEFSESGVGPSDHTSFYYANIPVLHFFTGTHVDYHKPSDDFEKINAVGIYKVLSLMTTIIRNTPVVNEFPFSATKVESTKAPKFTVTLGVMPDYLYEGEGMRLDGVSPDKPAAKAGLQTGDIITQLGAVQVSNMQSYMQALSQLKAGDTASLLYQRKGEVKRVEIQF